MKTIGILRICSRCGMEFEQPTTRKSRQRWCCQCWKSYRSDYRKKNLDHQQQYSREWKQNNRQRVTKYYTSTDKRRQKKRALDKQAAKIQREKVRQGISTRRVLGYLCSRAKVNAKHKKIVHNITVNDLLQLWEEDNLCAISRLPMVLPCGSLSRVSIDRINSSQGYTIENIQLVCMWVNLAKNKATNAEICEIVDSIRIQGR